MKKLILLFAIVPLMTIAQTPVPSELAAQELRLGFQLLDTYLGDKPFLNISAEDVYQRKVLVNYEKKSLDNFIFSVPSSEMINQFVSTDILIDKGKVKVDRYFTKVQEVEGLERLVKVDPDHEQYEYIRTLEELILLKESIWECIILTEKIMQYQKTKKTTFIKKI
ncbi:MAG: hypothetical protein MRY57_01400 [Candidatus Pacebacteria bacterium]|nr:hypothetical protein [Candidatus Paceibacterota bacterium]